MMTSLRMFMTNVVMNRRVPTAKMVRNSIVSCGVSPRLTDAM